MEMIQCGTDRNEKEDEMRLLSWNVNGIRAVHKKGFVDWVKEAKPEILCLQETKAQPEQIPAEISELTDWHQYWRSAERKGYSGVGLLTKMKPKEVRFGLGIPEFDTEGRTIIAFYDEFVLFNIYFPNGQQSAERLDFKMRFYDAFLNVADELRKESYSIVICGDVNTAHTEIDLARPKANEKTSGFLPEERAWMDELVSHGYLDTLRLFADEGEKYSWWSFRARARERNVGWRIDYFFVSENMRSRVKDAFILDDVMGSDHCPVGIELE